MKRFLVLGVCAVLVLAACGGKTPADTATVGGITPPSSPLRYSMAAGSIGGNFYIVGGGLAQTINRHLPQFFNMASEATGGGSANATMIQRGDAEFGIVMSSGLFEAKRGEAAWTNGVVHDNLRIAAPLYPSWLTVYTLTTSGIRSMNDVQGRIIGLGSRGMGMEPIFRRFLADRNIIPSQIHNDGHGATAVALGNGIIDVALTFSFPPFAAISELEASRDLFYVPLNAEEIRFLTDRYDFYVASALPAGSYRGATVDVPGVSEWNWLVTSRNVPDDMVYLAVKTIFENRADMVAVHPSGVHILPENLRHSNIPIHAGVVRYLREIGMDVPAHLIPPEYRR